MVEVHWVFSYATRGGAGVIYFVVFLLLLAAPFLLVLGCALILSSRISREEERRERTWHAMTTSDAMFCRRDDPR